MTEKLPVNNTSGYKGVSFHKPSLLWRWYVTEDCQSVTKGFARTKEDARDRRERFLRGEKVEGLGRGGKGHKRTRCLTCHKTIKRCVCCAPAFEVKAVSDFPKVKTNGLQSNYGAKQALTGNIGAQDRPQEVLTPDEILARAEAALGGRIILDPCAPADPSLWIAEQNLFLGPEAYEVEQRIKELVKDSSKEAKLARKMLKKKRKQLYVNGPGLKLTWNAPAFVNPPFEFLQVWMEKIVASTYPVVALLPVRPWRKWWMRNAKLADECIWLGPVKFKGHKSAAPFPMCVLSYGCNVPHMGKIEMERSKL